MFYGAHFLIYTRDAEGDRAFFRDVLEFPYVDAGGGWLVFGLPPAELGVHPADGTFVQQHADHDMLGCVFYLMCKDLKTCMETLRRKGVACTAVQQAEWGFSTSLQLPSGGRIGLYQPTHASPIEKP
jgi:hypothetical protein